MYYTANSLSCHICKIGSRLHSSWRRNSLKIKGNIMYDTLKNGNISNYEIRVNEYIMNEKTIDEFIGKNKNTSKRFLEHIKELIGEMKRAIKMLSAGKYKTEIAALMDDVEALENIREKLFSGLESAKTKFDEANKAQSGEKVEKSTEKAEQDNTEDASEDTEPLEGKTYVDEDGIEWFEFSTKDEAITQRDIERLRSIGRKSINEFTQSDYEKTQIKSATGNSGSFNRYNENIYYSSKDTFETYTYSLISENKMLKYLLGNLETRFKGVHKHEIDEASVGRLAKRMLKKTNSKYDLEKFTQRLTAIYDYFANSKDLMWEDLMGSMTEQI